MTFNDWLLELDEIFLADAGVTHDMKEDYNWRDEYENFVTPSDAYQEWKCNPELM